MCYVIPQRVFTVEGDHGPVRNGYMVSGSGAMNIDFFRATVMLFRKNYVCIFCRTLYVPAARAGDITTVSAN